MAAAGVGVVMDPAHTVRGAAGEDCVMLSLDPAWHRGLAVFSRVPLAGAAAAFAPLPRASTTTGPSAGRPSAAEPDAHRAVVQQGRHPR